MGRNLPFFSGFIIMIYFWCISGLGLLRYLSHFSCSCELYSHSISTSQSSYGAIDGFRV